MFDLTGKTALVTGAGQNVGAGIARALAGQGAEVVVNDYYLQRAEETVASITNAGGSAVASAFDVTDYPAVEAAVAEVGAIDILVNNAGSFGIGEMHVGPFIDLTPEPKPKQRSGSQPPNFTNSPTEASSSGPTTR